MERIVIKINYKVIIVIITINSVTIKIVIIVIIIIAKAGKIIKYYIICLINVKKNLFILFYTKKIILTIIII